MTVHGNPIVTSCQIRMARAALAWSRRDLAHKAGVSESTVRRIESCEDRANLTIGTYDAIVRCLSKNGMVFLASDKSMGPGVRLQSPKPDA